MDLGWEHFTHGADVGVRGFGRTREEAFEQAALALMAVSFDLSTVGERQSLPIECADATPDDEVLLVDWLNAVNYESDRRGMAFSRFRVSIDEARMLKGTAWGEPVDVMRHQPVVEVKGATMTELAVRRQGRRWIAQCVVDV